MPVRPVAKVSPLTADKVRYLYLAHGPEIFRFCLMRLGGDRARADDATADVFAAALDAYERTEPGDTWVRAWLYRIAKNVVSNHHRARQRDVGLFDRLLREVDRRQSDAERDGGEEAILRDDAARIARAITALREPRRTILAMRIAGEASYKEIAETMGMTVGAVEQALHRAKKQVRKSLEAQG